MKQKNYYEFKHIIELTGISERTFRYRMKVIKEKYKDQPELLFKKRHSWRIHHSLLFEFNHKYQINNTNKN
ncbi:hypothetical protein M4I21_13585 [Cellulophaga sp. 20_2_10]|uniref:hypothetical protein n=1 Tax=Cellulophaga sp. 20_2_10 TaxID=2942476 RepID=UPI00201AF61E|nr:hypothetical protein [Cellulophaga sp. 20_2_10]MCL5246850.1 hypothetical protein [Cellulophaga sp. 20_2_10]